ncbi:MAG: hypothetical protein KGS72_12715 [Cyanobacteria bacterium REEB67]|nr:hypothetical protein [Cyanobacteria bacterium REEB67]
MSCFDQPGPSACGVPQREMQGDPLRVDAHNIARELFSQDPRYQQHAMNDIRDEVRNLPPLQAEHFAHLLQEETRGQSPLSEVPEVRQDYNGQRYNTGNELLVMTDPYRGTEVLKQICHEDAGYDRGPDPGYNPGYDPGYDQGYNQPIAPPVIVQRQPMYDQNPVVTGIEQGVGIGVGNALVMGFFGHRR